MNEFRDIHGLLNQFWQMRRSTFFTSLEADLYYALVDEANTRRWEENFSISNGWLTAKIGTSEPSLIRARNKLKQCGLIKFVSGKTKRQPSRYALTYVTNYLNNFSSDVSKKQNNSNDYLNNFSSDVSQSVRSSVSPSVRQVKTKEVKHKNKDNTNTNKDFSKNNFEEENFSKNENFEKPIEEKISQPPAETEISPSKKVALKKVSKSSSTQKMQEAKVDALELPFESEEFQENWKDFRQVRKEMKKPVTPTAAKMIFKKLEKFGEEVATKALEASATNGWQGVFPENIVREQNYSAPKKNVKPPKIDLRNADYTL